MSNVIRQLSVRLGIEAASFNNGIRDAARQGTEFQRVIRPTSNLLRDMGGAMVSAGRSMTLAFTAPIAAVTGIGIAFNAMEEQAQVAFSTMLHSAEKAQAFLSDMKDFAAKTPFEFPELVMASKRMLAYGFAAEQVKPVLTAVGNAAAALGGGAESIQRITTAMGQMRAKGTVQAEEMRQLAEAGIPAWEILAKHLGVTIPEAMKKVEQRAVSAADGISALTAGMTDKFGGMMEKQATTFNGLVSTIKDESRFIAGELTEGLFNAIKGPTLAFTESMHNVRVQLEGWSDGQKAVLAGAALLVAGIGPAVWIFGQLAGSISNLMVLGTKLAPIFLSLAQTASGFGILGAVKSWGDLGIAVSLIGESSVLATAGMVGLSAAIGIGLGMIANYAIEALGLQDNLDNFTNNTLERLGFQWGATSDAQESAAFTADAMARGLGKVTAAAKEAVEPVENYAKANKYLADAFEKGNKVIREAEHAFTESLYPATILEGAIRALTGSFSEADIIKVYGDRIIEVTEEQREHGYAVTETMDRLYKLSKAERDAAASADTLTKSTKESKDEMNRLNAQFIASLRPADDLFKTLDKLNGQWSKDEIIKVYADQIIEMTKRQRENGIVISAAMLEFEKLALAYKKVSTAADAAKTSQDAASASAAAAAAAAAKLHASLNPPVVDVNGRPVLDASGKQVQYDPFDPFGLNAKNAESVRNTTTPTSNIASQPALPAALNLGNNAQGPGGSPMATGTGNTLQTAPGAYWPGGWVNGIYFPESGRPQGTSTFGAERADTVRGTLPGSDTGTQFNAATPVTVVQQLDVSLVTNQKIDDQLVRTDLIPKILEALKNGSGLEELTRLIKMAMGGVTSTKGA